MEFRSLEEFEREFFARYGAAQRGANPYGPFLGEAAPSPAGEAAKTRPTPLQTACAVFSWVIIAVLAAATLAVFLPMTFGAKMLSVQSGSMEPEIPVGSLVLVVPTKFEKIEVGNDVTYKLNPGEVPGTNVTHRVMDIDRENSALVTQG
ncbi:MAG: signal peptidase I, partial [Oscillospiraceae bacterium]|nr:signal peptidase I [Oscillospiraceae bacterium]